MDFACSPDRRVHNGLRIGPAGFVNYPTGVRRALVAADESCRRAGGTRVTLTVNAVRRLDLNGDGRDDYIADFHETECGGNEDQKIAAACPAEEGRTSDNAAAHCAKYSTTGVRGYEILSGRGPGEIRFLLHGSYCGGHGNPSCEKTRRITSEPFKFEQPN